MKVVITGVHLSPAVAVARKLRQQKNTVIFIGRKYALEGDSAISLDYKVITKENFIFKNLTTGRLQRHWTRYTLPSLLKIPIGFIQAIFLLITDRPDLILSFGGYLSLPVATAGFLLGIPIVIHEQTLGAGLANKVEASLAKKVLISWESSRKYFPKEKTILTGNPVREEIFKKIQSAKWADEIRNSDKGLPIIYITGGSLGSHKINLVVEKIIDKLVKNYIVIHQTGDAKKFKDFDRLTKLKNKFAGGFRHRYLLVKHVAPDEIGWILNRASLVVSRSGINTVTELIFLGKPAILIPLNNEQKENAMFLKKIGLAEVLLDKEFSSDQLYNFVIRMLGNIKDYKKNKNLVKGLIKQDAVGMITQILYEVSNRR